jgi:mRNA-degrading endonuclease HigB of HigAB toxin-antitoxin module
VPALTTHGPFGARCLDNARRLDTVICWKDPFRSIKWNRLFHFWEFAETADWKTPEDVKKAHPKVSILKGGRMVFNIKANDFRLVALVQYVDSILMIRFFGSHEEYDGIDAETV